jgi:hypothetical protein
MLNMVVRRETARLLKVKHSIQLAFIKGTQQYFLQEPENVVGLQVVL